MELLGTVVRLQVQRSRLKPGPRATRVYDPAPLREVDALELGPAGVTGLIGGEVLLDVHHADHPDTRFRGVNGLSLLPRAHYVRLRERFGGHLVDGVAGESLLLDTDGRLDTDGLWDPDALAGPLVLDTGGGRIELLNGQVAAPCVEFSRFCLGRGAGGPDDEELAAALDALDRGARGFYVTPSGSGRIEAGARLLRG